MKFGTVEARVNEKVPHYPPYDSCVHSLTVIKIGISTK